MPGSKVAHKPYKKARPWLSEHGVLPENIRHPAFPPTSLVPSMGNVAKAIIPAGPSLTQPRDLGDMEVKEELLDYYTGSYEMINKFFAQIIEPSPSTDRDNIVRAIEEEGLMFLYKESLTKSRESDS
ncbi:hypothetical protein CRG98_015763 [Punica granatum]|uniref:Uncharacterized protein n=1 Tax=Punica granatum TaxID=22663 RepID=A0A2I0K5G4_PUNGR|nr:hypothetical protein CRG98_015763 [Punica granatum]